MFTLYYIMNHFPVIVNSEIATYYGVEAQNAIRVLTAERFGGIICRLMVCCSRILLSVSVCPEGERNFRFTLIILDFSVIIRILFAFLYSLKG